MMNPLISVVVPIYNVEQYLYKCIQSIVNQSYKDFEIVLVNDGSTDASADIIYAFKENDQRIVVINKENGGSVSARRAGVAIAAGQYIMLVDGDDWLKKDAVRDICDILVTDRDIDIICTGYTRVCQDGEAIKITETFAAGVYDKEHLEKTIYPYMMSCYANIPGAIIRANWAKIIRKDLLIEVLNKMDDRITVGEDAATSYACLFLADKVYLDSNNVNYCYRYMLESISHRYDNNWLENIRNCANWMYAFFAEHSYTQLKDSIACEVFSIFYEQWDYEIGHCLRHRLSVKKRFLEIAQSSIGQAVFSNINIMQLPLSLKVRIKIYLMKQGIVWPFIITYRIRHLKKGTI